MKNAETESFQLKNKITRDLQTQDRGTEQKLKVANGKLDALSMKLIDMIEEKIMEVNTTLHNIDDKLSRVEDTKEVLEKVDDRIQDSSNMLTSMVGNL